MFERVAITVVEGEANEAGEIALVRRRCTSSRLTTSTPSGAIPDHAAEKARRDFEDTIGLEAVGPRRAHMVQRQDCADAGDERRDAEYAPENKAIPGRRG